MATELFRLYEASDAGADGYPLAWHQTIKHLVREQAGQRCIRCKHPYKNGEHGRGEWTPCDALCEHKGPYRYRPCEGSEWYESLDDEFDATTGPAVEAGHLIEARYRILTVHHLDGIKINLRWWNLVALCQRCHLSIQGKVKLSRPYFFEHSEWFQPYVAGFYAATILGKELSREEVAARLNELLGLQQRAMSA